MWVWNDYLLPTLVLDIKQYRTIPMAVQYFRGSFGHVQMGPMMASIMIDIIPIIIVYLVCQKYIIEGVVAGAVKADPFEKILWGCCKETSASPVIF